MKKCATILLLLAMLLPTFTACGIGGGEQDTTPPSQTDTETESASETVRHHNVPTLDFGGETFCTYYIDWQGYQYYFFADESTGENMNDAIYERTLRVEDTLQVKMTRDSIPGASVGEMYPTLRALANAGDDTYQQVLLHCIYCVENLASGGLLYNFDDFQYVDTSADWWNQRMMDTLRLGEKTYFGISDFMIPCPYVVFFNKELIELNNLDNPYQLVYDKKWTLDAFQSMAQAAVLDVNGDGKMDRNDTWGISAPEVSKYNSFLTGSGQFMTEKGDDGRIRLAMNTDKTISLVERFAAMAKEEGMIYMPASMKESDQLAFDDNRLLFYLDSVAEAVRFREYEHDIGILPYPLYDENQADYISLDWGGLMCVPAIVKNPDMVGAVLELLAFESADTVIPAYYDVLLDGRLARDPDTRKMLDITFDTIAYEVGANYFGFSEGFTNLFFVLGYLSIRQKSTDFASFYKKNEKQANNTISRFYKALDATEGVTTEE